MSNRQSDLSEFGDDLAATRMDSTLEWAEVSRAIPAVREKADPSVDPTDEGSSDEGLTIEFERASGETFATWLEKPADWDITTSDLVLLFEFWGLDPGEIERLESETFETPVTYSRGDGVWRPDWDEIARSVHTEELEEADDE